MFSHIRQKLFLNGYIPSTIIDIGAYHGNWTTECLNIYPNCNYILFEAIDYSELKKFNQYSNIKIINEVLNDRECSINWYERRDTGDSIYKELSHHYKDIVPNQRTSYPLNKFIDNNIKNIFMKIDCQGAEISILKGATNLYEKTDFILLKIPLFGQYNENTSNFINHISFMDSIGFVPYDIMETHNINNFTMKIDMCFINKKHSFNFLVNDRLQIKNYNINNSKTIAFLSNKLTLRGTEVALYDYADYNERILGNKSIIITRDYNIIKNDFDVDEQAYNKFKSRFQVEYYNNDNKQNDLDYIVQKNQITHLYIIKAGENEGLLSNKCKNLIHVVFTPTQPHGQVYSVLGTTINELFNTEFPVVPYMVTLPQTNDNLREELNIPKEAIVFGRYGGRDSFDIRFVYESIKKILQCRSDIYFIFLNTDVFYEHKQIIYLPGTTNLEYKRKFINTSDALIHARLGGETFGLTCGEFAICEKPVITYRDSREREHLIILKEKAVTYTNEIEVFNIFNTFSKDKYDMKNNGYMFYTPENVMEIFKKVFIDN